MRELLSELSFQLVPLARTKTEEKYTPKRLHKALEKRVNKIMRGLTQENFLLTQGRYSEISTLYFQVFSYILCFCSVRTPLYTICLYFPPLF